VTFVTYEIRFKTGFFKTQCYILNIFERKMILTPREKDKLEQIVIIDKDLIAVEIINKDSSGAEIEIKTKNESYFGIITTGIDQLLLTLIREFGNKITVI